MLQEPLLLFSCAYNDLHFKRSAQCINGNREAVKELLSRQLAGAALLHTIALQLQGQAHDLSGGVEKLPRHIKLIDRPREPPVAERFARFGRTLKEPSAVASMDIDK